MDKFNISQLIKENHSEFITYINSLTDKEYLYQYEYKWNAGQHTDHILKSINKLNKVLKFPKWVIKYKFGYANRASKSYEELVAKYQERLKNAKSTPKKFQPKTATHNNKKELLKNIKKNVNSLIKKIHKFSEEELDYYILPHPLLGKQTLREHAYFSIHHVKQHQNFIKRDLSKNKL